MTILPLKDVRVWLIGSQPDDEPGYDSGPLLHFVRSLAAAVFREGGTLLHGSHPSFIEPLEDAARAVLGAGRQQSSLRLAISEKHVRTDAEKAEMQRRKEFAEVSMLPSAPGDANENLLPMRDWLVQRADIAVAVGGKWWHTAKDRAGLPKELETVLDHGMPAFVLQCFGGAAKGMAEDTSVMGRLRNGLSEGLTSALNFNTDPASQAELLVDQMKRLPLLRTKADRRGRFRILALDGGGLRGVFPAAVLTKWAECMGVHGHEIVRHFDLVAGTSTGAILALGMGLGLQPADMLKFYQIEGPKIFPWKLPLSGVASAKFDARILQSALESAFSRGGALPDLSKSLCRLVIPTAQAEYGRAKVLTTPHTLGRSVLAGWTAVDAALASAAAPTYFEAAWSPDEAAPVPYLDGGIWANNPSLAAIAEAVGQLSEPLDRVHVLNIGTLGNEQSFMDRLKSGMAGWGPRVADLFGTAQETGTEELVRTLLGNDRYLRINAQTSKKIDLASVDDIEGMTRRGLTVGEDTYKQVWDRFLSHGHASDWRG